MGTEEACFIFGERNWVLNDVREEDGERVVFPQTQRLGSIVRTL